MSPFTDIKACLFAPAFPYPPLRGCGSVYMEEKLKSIMGGVFGLPPASINESTRREDIPKWDSAAHIELVLALEGEFGVQFADEEVIGLVNYNIILATLKKLVARDAPGAVFK